jgi:basic membrane protein A and related proteins
VGRRPNVTYLTFAEEEGSFLAGAAAALKSRTGEIGFIGGTDFPLIWRFHAGYEAGARAVDPDIRVRATYLTRPPDFSGFDSYALARGAAGRLYSDGADIIYHAAGRSGFGVFEAARAISERRGRHLWAIGVDDDQYRSVAGFDASELGFSPKAVQPHVLTSMLKRVDRAAYMALADYAAGTLTPGARRLGLTSGGVGLSTSGGFIDDIRPELEHLREQIISGEIKVPTVPASRRGGS